MTGPLLAAGREVDVYALDERRVLRRYRREADVTGEVTALPPWPGAAAGSAVLHLELHPERVLACAR